jgi:beta-glucosidase
MSLARRTFLALASSGIGGCLPVPGGGTLLRPDPPTARPTPSAEALLARMTLAEKIGQMTQADLNALRNRESDIGTFFLGSVLSGGDSLPRPNERERWADTYDRLQGHAVRTRLGIPILYGIDAVHGMNAVKGATVFPHNIGLGATRNAALVEQAARITAREVAGTGIDWTFAPCLAVPQDERWGRTYEGFGETAEIVAPLGAAAVRGYQNGDPKILACAKHFVADGATAGGRDRGDAQITEDVLRKVHLPAYQAAIEAGVGSIMVSYSSWNGDPMHGNQRMITDVLKGEMGFQGFVVTDWEAIDQMKMSYDRGIALAINAGIDMVMVPNRYRVFIDLLTKLVEGGHVAMARIDDAVLRILRQKIAMNLWQKPATDRAFNALIGCDEHRKVARQAVRESLVLLKNQGQTLPLTSKYKHIAVAGRFADDVGAMCGGWTVSWRGKLGDITPGTSVFEAIVKRAGDKADVTLARKGEIDSGADVIVAVVGEKPYAEGGGDRANLDLAAEDRALLTALSKTGKPLVVVLLSGRPMILKEALGDANAFIAAWLPGTEGDGVADILFGDFKPTGKLPHAWPRDMAQVPLAADVGAADCLFPLGFGLSYEPS